MISAAQIWVEVYAVLDLWFACSMAVNYHLFLSCLGIEAMWYGPTLHFS